MINPGGTAAVESPNGLGAPARGSHGIAWLASAWQWGSLQAGRRARQGCHQAPGGGESLCSSPVRGRGESPGSSPLPGRGES